MATIHDFNSPGHRYTVPNRSDPMGGYNPRGPPYPDPSNAHVVCFTASGAGIRTAEVIDYTGAPLYYFKSIGGRHLEMFDSADSVIVRYQDGQVHYSGNEVVRAKEFIERGSPGNTGAVLTYGGQRYEFVQEIFYAIVRTTPASERVAIVYNYTGKPAVEMVSAGLHVSGLQAYIVFVTALMESGVMRKAGAVSKAIRNIMPGKNKAGAGYA